MTCQQAEPLLARAADGTLDAERNGALARHLHACADCRDALDAQRAMREILAGRPKTPVPLGFATRVMANLPAREPSSAAGWLDALNWRAWTLRLAPLAGALFVGVTLGLGPSAEVAEAGAAEVADLVTAWVADETTAGEVQDPAAVEPVTRLWQYGDELTDDLLIDVLLAADPRDTLSGPNEAGR